MGRVPENVFVRALGGAELPYVRLIHENPCARQAIEIHCVLEFQSDHDSHQLEEALRSAWKALRLLKSPDIATTCDPGEQKKYYQVASPAALTEWEQQTFHTFPVGTTISQAFAWYHERVEWMPTVVWWPAAEPSGRHVLLFFISHWRTEASGALLAMDQLFSMAADLLRSESSIRKALQSYVFGSEIQYLTPTLEDVLMPNRSASSDAHQRVAERWKEFVSKLPCIDFPLAAPVSNPPSLLRRIENIYDIPSTRALVGACKSHQVTVTSMVHAAYILALRQMVDESQLSRAWTAVMPMEVRKRLPASSPFREQGIWNASQLLLLSVAPDFNGLVDGARQCKRQYEQCSSDTWLYEDMRAMTDHALHTPPPAPPPAPSPTPYLSSLGVLERGIMEGRHEGIQVEEVAVWADNIGPGLVLTLWTWRDRLHAQVTWNEAYHHHDAVQKMMSLMDQRLREDLSIPWQIESTRGQEW